MNSEQLRKIIEAAIFAAGRPLDVTALQHLFDIVDQPDREEIRAALEDIEADCSDRGYELKQTASGYRFQVREELGHWISRMWEEKPRKYSRALLETLALIAYRQPITRGEIENVRGVSVSSEIIKTLLERDWVRVVGHRDVPGKPALYATTSQFLDYFNLKGLNELPPLSDIKDISSINPELQFGEPAETSDESSLNPDTDGGNTFTETESNDETSEPFVHKLDSEGDTLAVSSITIEKSDQASDGHSNSVVLKLASEQQ